MKKLFLGGILAIVRSGAGCAGQRGRADVQLQLMHSFAVGYNDATPAANKVTIQLSGSAIQALDANGNVITCIGSPTVSNTDSIVVTDNGPPGHNSILDLNERNGAFQPGFMAVPPPGLGEIVYTANDGTDQLQIDGTDNADNWLFGQTAGGAIGANLNADDDAIDRLIAHDGVRDKKIDCGPGNNKHESFTRDHKDPKPKSC